MENDVSLWTQLLTILAWTMYGLLIFLFSCSMYFTIKTRCQKELEVHKYLLSLRLNCDLRGIDISSLNTEMEQPTPKIQ